VVHGVLHAHGYDHDRAEHARRMEGLEAAILARLGIPDPYRAVAG
jgi:probable rRNA maturation factor